MVLYLGVQGWRLLDIHSLPDLQWKVSCWLLVRHRRLLGSLLEHVSHRQRFRLPVFELLGLLHMYPGDFESDWYRTVKVVRVVFVARRGVVSLDPLEEVALLVLTLRTQN